MIPYLKRTATILFWLGAGFVGISILLVLALRWINPPSSMVIAAWQWSNGREALHQWRSLDRISPQLQIAVIASEDQKFPEHFGFDLESIQKALDENRRRTRGASTITQQTAKNLFLWHGRSYARKALEAWFTLLMEICWPKQRILEIYLNIAEFGEGVYGAQAAAETFFNTSARNIGPYQAALLAAVLPNPKRMSARNPSDYVRSRAVTIRNMADKLGGTAYISRL